MSGRFAPPPPPRLACGPARSPAQLLPHGAERGRATCAQAKDKTLRYVEGGRHEVSSPSRQR